MHASTTKHGFRILASRAGRVTTSIPPDTATCDDCLAELFDPADRRHRYAFINCTQCGPRYTLTRALPYDRAQTSMAAFAQCPRCLREYTDPLDRRFHAEPNACPVCGPALALVDAHGQPIDGDPIAATLALLRGGHIVAIKGLGGFHLACDARNAAAVALLRERKQREEKPFAVMAANLASAAALGARRRRRAGAAAVARAADRAAADAGRLCRSSSPASRRASNVLGMMLPCTPIQFLLFHEAAGRPAGTAWLHEPQDLLLVMTSANPGGEPLVIGNDEALARLQGIADALLLHDRDIVARCDDSVLRLVGHRRARSSSAARAATRRGRSSCRAPGPSVLATGAWLKNTVCITRGDEAFLSPHVGDLDNAATCGALVEMVDHLCAVLDVKPQAVAHDLHPDFFSTRFALEYADTRGRCRRMPCSTTTRTSRRSRPSTASTARCSAWRSTASASATTAPRGAASCCSSTAPPFARLGHLAPIAMPGGDAAAREPWRMAAAALQRIGRGAQIAARFGTGPRPPPWRRCWPATCAARRPPAWAAGSTPLPACCGVRETSAYEGQAPMLLEALAAAVPVDRAIDERRRAERPGFASAPTPCSIRRR